MKFHNNLFFVFILIVLSIGCKNQNADNTSNASAPISPALKNKALADSFAILRGAWVNAKYLDGMNKGTALSKIQFQNTEEVTTLDIDSSNVQMGFNFHEGTGSTLHKLDEKHFTLVSNEGSGEMKEKIEIVDDQTIKVGKATLKKVGVDKTSGVILGYQLVGGQYQFNQTPVQFNEDGTITGLDPYTHYNILYDYNGEIDPPNQVELISTSEKSDYFAFEKQKNGLTLFDLKCVQKDGDVCMKQVKSKVHWAFVAK